jgi:L-lactate dehydrogenase complex protein LldG
MTSAEQTGSARDTIMRSIRSHLAASRPHDEREVASHYVLEAGKPGAESIDLVAHGGSLVELFKENLEAVNGHCVVVRGEAEVVQALTNIIAKLQGTPLKARSIALSDNSAVERLVHQVPLEVDELSIAPSAPEVFRFDVGITTAQAAIAETGTLVLDAARERHRLVSLVPPVHIAIVEAAKIQETLGQILAELQQGSAELSSTITFVTGPSRTADIELTLAIGVHGPQELYVIVDEEPFPPG